MLELVEIPAALRGIVRAGVAGLSFACRDVRPRAEAAVQAGFEVGGPHDIVAVDDTVSTLARIAVGGVPFELISFGGKPESSPEPS